MDNDNWIKPSELPAYFKGNIWVAWKNMEGEPILRNVWKELGDRHFICSINGGHSINIMTDDKFRVMIPKVPSKPSNFQFEKRDKMFYVYENNQPAILRNSKTNELVKGWDNNGFETKREAEIYAYHWAYPMPYEECKATAPEMELNVDYNYSMATDFQVLMKIVEQ